MSRRTLRLAALSVVAALGLSLVVAAPAVADPVVLLQHDDAHLSITVERDGTNVHIEVDNVGTQVEKLGLGAYLSTPATEDLLWQSGPFADQFRADIDPGATYAIDAPFWPGTMATIYRERDTTPEAVASFMTEGDWVQLVMSGTPEEPHVRVGPELHWQDSTALPGEGLLVSAVEVPTLGPVEVVVSTDAQIDFVGDQVVLSPGSTARTIGSTMISAVVDGEGYRVGFTTVVELPSDLPPGDYQVFLSQNGTPIPSYNEELLTVSAGSPQAAAAGAVAITGRARLHDTLTAVTSGWDPAATLVYQWYADGQPVERGIESTLVLDYYENGKIVTVEVLAWRDGYARARALSAPTASVAHDFFTQTSPPTISGSFAVGQKLTAIAPVWAPTTGFTYGWYVDFQATGVTTKTYTIQPGDLGKQVAVLVSSTRLGYHDTSYFSEWSAPVALGTIKAPATRPTITGAASPKVGKVLTANVGSLANWTTGVSFGYQWLVNGVDVPGAVDATFAVPSEALGLTVGLRVTASADGYADLVREAPATAAVAEGVFTPKGTPAILGTLAVGETLTADPGTWDAAATLSYQWEIVNVGIASTDPTFVIPPNAQNRKIRLTVTASAPGYLTVARNAVTATKVP